MKVVSLSFCLFMAIASTKAVKSQKIISDQTKPISGIRTIVTDIEPIFKMKALQVGATAEIKSGDSTFTLSFYRQEIPTYTNAVDTTDEKGTVLLTNQQKVYGKYRSSAVISGYRMISFTFLPGDFRMLAQYGAVAVAGRDLGEISIDARYNNSIRNISDAIIKRLKM